MEIKNLFYPVLFVFLWSSGLVAAKYILIDVEPFSVVSIRMGVAFIILLLLRPLFKVEPNKKHIALKDFFISGLLIHAIFLSGIFYSMYNGLPAGITGLFVGMQPILIMVILLIFSKNTIRPKQIIGIILGFIGVLIVLNAKSDLNIIFELDYKLYLPAFLGVCSLAIGTIYQKNYCTGYSIYTISLWQYLFSFLFTGLIAIVFEDKHLSFNITWILSMLWLSVVVSIGAVSILFLLLRKKDAINVGSYFFLIPVFTMGMSILIFNEKIYFDYLLGAILAILGIYLASRTSGVLK